MKLISFAIASMIDAHFRQNISGKPSDILHISGRQTKGDASTGSKVLFDMIGAVITKLSAFAASIQQHRQDKKAIAQILRLNPHLQNDVGLRENHVWGLKTGALSLDDINKSRLRYETGMKNAVVNLNPEPARIMSKSVLEIDSANQQDFELARCC